MLPPDWPPLLPKGRTHQLRVHCSARGHPIVGDLTYGQALGQEDQPFRMMLHAFYLRIPTSAECVEACTPDPFVPALDACWSPHTLLQPLDELVQVLRAAPDPDLGQAGPPHPPRQRCSGPPACSGCRSGRWSQTTESIMLGGEQQAGTLQGRLLVRALDSPCCGQA